MEKPPPAPFTPDELKAAYALVTKPGTAGEMIEGPFPGPHPEPVGYSLDLTTLVLLSLLSEDIHARVKAFTEQQSFPHEFTDEIARTRERIRKKIIAP